jgi:hypothetical protein
MLALLRRRLHRQPQRVCEGVIYACGTTNIFTDNGSLELKIKIHVACTQVRAAKECLRESFLPLAQLSGHSSDSTVLFKGDYFQSSVVDADILLPRSLYGLVKKLIGFILL